MELELYIISGCRVGEKISLPDVQQPLQQTLPWVLEDEAIELRFRVPRHFANATLELYQHEIDATRIEYSDTSETTEFFWVPKISGYGTEKLFHNYFGISELTVLLKDADGTIVDLVSFQPVQVAAKATTAENVERMFDYLAGLSSEALHSVFSATRHSAGFNEGEASPSQALERIENSIELIRESLPILIHRPITRLIPEHKLISPSGSEEMDDSSIGWLLENLSVLEPDENPDQAHLMYEDQHYRASALRMPVLNENTDIYENWILHGFVDLLIREAQGLSQKYLAVCKSANKNQSLPRGYVSFFDKISRFKSHLIGSQLNKIDSMTDTLKQIKAHLDMRMPVTRALNERPIITPRVRINYVYLDLFVDVIKWHQNGSVDWSVYENLFAIQSIPDLFEAYSYFRVVQAVNRYFNSTIPDSEACPVLETKFKDGSGINLRILREPDYWTPEHNLSKNKEIVNSEAFSSRGQYDYKSRGQSGPYAKRVPDIVIEIHRPESNEIQLLVLDAKYTRRGKAFAFYLPELTMKYVHGIHRREQEVPTVTSLTILYTDNERSEFSSFHHGEMGIFGETPVMPNLQTLGLILGADRNQDKLQPLVTRLLDINGVRG
ncbi:hypothetical protein [Marinobacterium weihaiense]|uniref:DUF2357 domain-containing protein n=1 Tax=Marinobacterium weihaiense TaxID=2851016 RepID=A0ABS6M985_9GAMM|nr:hypothetical protein [Marinobacterium weihaiense]MBV0932851.1 hypothetical protein [Marinobacterium weihaiense]